MTTYQRLTAKGRGAIAVIEINGQDAVKVIDACFTPVGSRKFANKDQPLVYGHWNSTGEDLLVVTAAVDRYEIQCHGSEAAVAAIIADVSGQGAVPHRPNDPPKLLAQRLTVARFESDIRQLLATAATRRTAQHLLHQLQVAPSALAEMASQRDTNRIQTVLSYRDFGTKFHCRQSIVLCGRPNAGKSCLVNAILGFERSIVTPVAGTTRDVLTHHAVVDGWPVAISDTAGLRVGGGQIEQLGIGKAKLQIQNADLVAAVIDATDPQSWGFGIKSHEEIKPHVVVINKIDLQPVFNARDEMAKWSDLGVPVVAVSATQKTGVGELLDVVSRLLFPDVPPIDQPIPLTAAQVEDLNEALRRSH